MTARTFKCRHCKRIRPRNPRLKSQEYCGARSCQNARKNKWRQEKLESDGAYRQGVKDSRKGWNESNKGYWSDYRKKNESYTKNNRKKQAARNAMRRTRLIAQRDALESFFDDNSNRYKIRPVNEKVIAKRDALIVEIVAISTE